MSFPNVGFRAQESVLWVDSDRIGESMRAAKLLGVTYIGVSPKHGYHLDTLEFLERYPEVERIFLPFAAGYDLSALHGLNRLRHLTIAESRKPLKLEWFPDLEEFYADWHQRIVWGSAAKLRSIYLRRYSPPNGDLSALPALPNLQALELNQGSVRSLAGIENFPQLTRLELYNLKRLESVRHICALGAHLAFFQAGSCRSVTDFETVSCLEKLEVLRLNDCGKVKSINFVAKLSKLREFRFVETVVEDGNLTPLLGLESVGFLPQEGYTHTPKQIDAVIRERSRTDAS